MATPFAEILRLPPMYGGNARDSDLFALVRLTR